MSDSNVIAFHDDQSFQQMAQLVDPQQLMLIDFTATWCGPCQRIAPLLNELSQQYPNVVMAKVDVDDCPNTAQAFQVEGMPTFVFLRNRQEVARFSGADPNQLRMHLQNLSNQGPPQGQPQRSMLNDDPADF